MEVHFEDCVPLQIDGTEVGNLLYYAATHGSARAGDVIAGLIAAEIAFQADERDTVVEELRQLEHNAVQLAKAARQMHTLVDNAADLGQAGGLFELGALARKFAEAGA